MLVLTRKENQSIKIGDDIEIMVVSIETDWVKLGIMASESVTVDRQEIYEKKKSGEEEKQE